MKKVVLGIICSITSICPVFAAVNESPVVSSNQLQNSSCLAPDNHTLCYWTVHNQLTTPILVKSDKVTKTIPANTKDSVERNASTLFTANLNGDVKKIDDAKKHYINIFINSKTKNFDLINK